MNQYYYSRQSGKIYDEDPISDQDTYSLRVHHRPELFLARHYNTVAVEKLCPVLIDIMLNGRLIAYCKYTPGRLTIDKHVVIPVDLNDCILKNLCLNVCKIYFTYIKKQVQPLPEIDF